MTQRYKPERVGPRISRIRDRLRWALVFRVTPAIRGFIRPHPGPLPQERVDHSALAGGNECRSSGGRLGTAGHNCLITKSSSPCACVALCMAAGALLLAGSSCLAPKPDAHLDTESGLLLLSIPAGSHPLLGTNDVIRLAFQAASDHGHWRTQFYSCRALSFEPVVGGVRLTNQWLMHFTQTPPIPSDGFWVIVDEITGETRLRHP
jgi:hypothetical protein